jgi:hypothetical protein
MKHLALKRFLQLRETIYAEEVVASLNVASMAKIVYHDIYGFEFYLVFARSKDPAEILS